MKGSEIAHRISSADTEPEGPVLQEEAAGELEDSFAMFGIASEQEQQQALCEHVRRFGSLQIQDADIWSASNEPLAATVERLADAAMQRRPYNNRCRLHRYSNRTEGYRRAVKSLRSWLRKMHKEDERIARNAGDVLLADTRDRQFQICFDPEEADRRNAFLAWVVERHEGTLVSIHCPACDREWQTHTPTLFPITCFCSRSMVAHPASAIEYVERYKREHPLSSMNGPSRVPPAFTKRVDDEPADIASLLSAKHLRVLRRFSGMKCVRSRNELRCKRSTYVALLRLGLLEQLEPDKFRRTKLGSEVLFALQGLKVVK